MYFLAVERVRVVMHPKPRVGSQRLKRYAPFVLIPMLSAAAPLLLLPAITRYFGAGGWVAVAVGQSVGGAASVLIELGFLLTGPQFIAQATAAQRRQLLRESARAKWAVFTALSIPTVTIACWVAPNFKAAAAVASIGGAAAGLSTTWYYLGRARPMRILTTEAIPALLGDLVAVILLILGAQLWLGTLATAIPALLTPVIVAKLELASPLTRRSIVGDRTIRSTIHAQVPAVSGRAASSLYIALPVTLVTAVAPGSAAVFAAAERTQRMVLAIVQAVPNAMQSWVGDSRQESLGRAFRLSLYINFLLGVATASAYLLLAPPISKLIFSSEATIPHQLAALCGVVIVLSCTSRATGGLVLVRMGAVGRIALSAAAGAIVGLLSIPALSAAGGYLGGMTGEIVAELTVLIIQGAAINRLHNRQRSEAM